MSMRTYYEYPLYDQHELCPTAKQVDVDAYICECKKVSECPGWQAAKKIHKVSPRRIN